MGRRLGRVGVACHLMALGGNTFFHHKRGTVALNPHHLPAAMSREAHLGTRGEKVQWGP